ncbi:hypothetical protein GMES_0231 [Paraglaciecola mesophila KMM 241]|uniref:AB hydrolase-1 domain-containing protein n=1 Tax=Paraglaciecola mesophila KMM 241 TaxID=1128912 RepID=K6ZGM7_9ALTE|nr:alpha/beta hydrolase [Paraglaciecola mesophila]GAC22540.1 hypothetical protein GMES_0231 [Paraglaciecola mesophila KMM 241]
MNFNYIVRLILILTPLMAIGCRDNSSLSVIDESQRSKINDLGYTAHYTTVNGIRIHYVQEGTGSLMLFLHGFPYFGSAWDPLLSEFSQDHQVVAPDNRGYGYSQKPADVSEYKIEKLVTDVRQLIEQLSRNNKVILVGHDWGGVLAWSVAQTSPELISKLIIINAPPFNVFLDVLSTSTSQREASHYMHKLDSWYAHLLFAIKGPELIWRGSARLYEEGHVDERFKLAFLNAWQQPGAAQGAVNWYQANVPEFDAINDSHYWPSKETRITVPSLLIWSQRDKAFTQDTFEAIKANVDNLRIHSIDTDSHVPFLDHTEEVIKVMRAFIAGESSEHSNR